MRRLAVFSLLILSTSTFSQDFNNPFLDKQVKKLIENAINRIVKEKVEAIKKELEVKYQAQLIKLKLEKLKLQEELAKFKQNNSQSPTKEVEKKENSTPQPTIVDTSFAKVPDIKVKAEVLLGDKIKLLTSKGWIEKGKELNGWKVENIDIKKKVIVLKGNGKIQEIKYSLR